jgi:hypothetical protein
MKRKLLTLVSRTDRKKNEIRQDWSSPALDNARTVCQLLSNLGSDVPGLQAAGLVAVQIVDIIKVVRLRPEQCSTNEHFAENKRKQDRL